MFLYTKPCITIINNCTLVIYFIIRETLIKEFVKLEGNNDIKNIIIILYTIY